MQLMTTEDYTDDRNLFTLNKKDLFENEGESRLWGGVNGLLRGEKRNRGTLVSIEDCSWQSPFIQRKIIYYGDGHPDVVEKILIPGNNSLQVSPFLDNSSVYSATSMHSLYSAVEIESSKYQDTKVFPSFPPLLLSVYPSLTLSLSIYLSIYLSISLSFSLSLCLPLFSSLSLSLLLALKLPLLSFPHFLFLFSLSLHPLSLPLSLSFSLSVSLLLPFSLSLSFSLPLSFPLPCIFVTLSLLTMIFTNYDLLLLQEPVLLTPPPEERGHGKITLLTYYHYFRSGGNYLMLAAVLLVFLLGQVRLGGGKWI